MAGAIRNEHHLASLRLERRVVSRTSVVSLGMWRGRDLLDETLVASDELGFPREAPDADRRERAKRAQHELFHAHFSLPARVERWLADIARATMAKDEPLWIEIRRSSPELAFVPWEQLLLPLDRPIFHLPSFVVPPRYLYGDTMRMAICASSPAAKTPFEVGPFVADLAHHIAASGVPTTELHVFADAHAYQQLSQVKGAPPHTVVVHDPGRAADFGEGGTRGLSDGRVRSPWLRWMLDELRSTPTDVVHFAAPGYFSDERGALALARSPVVNVDRRTSHFVGAEELAAFLNLVGALGVGFSQPTTDRWSLGLRLLADQLAFLRPGPVVLHRDVTTDTPLGRAYGFLFAPIPQDPPRVPDLSIYCHPLRLTRFAEEAPLPVAPRVTAMQQRMLGPERAKGAFAKSTPYGNTEPTWKRSMRLAVDQALVDVSNRSSLGSREEAVQQGTERALQILDDLLGGES